MFLVTGEGDNGQDLDFSKPNVELFNLLVCALMLPEPLDYGWEGLKKLASL
jgi:hypothetical protein